MNNEDIIVDNMIKYIEDLERNIQAAKLTNNQSKNHAVSNIIKQLDKEIKEHDLDEN